MATLPPYVATGEVIESAWGNAVVDNLAEVKDNSGNVQITVPTNYSGTFFVRRNFRSVWMVLNLTRTGANLSGTNQLFGFVPVGYRPSASFGTTAIVSESNDTFRATINAAGEIFVNALTIAQGRVVSITEHWEL